VAVAEHKELQAQCLAKVDQVVEVTRLTTGELPEIPVYNSALMDMVKVFQDQPDQKPQEGIFVVEQAAAQAATPLLAQLLDLELLIILLEPM
jgi:hypothetical protein